MSNYSKNIQLDTASVVFNVISLFGGALLIGGAFGWQAGLGAFLLTAVSRVPNLRAASTLYKKDLVNAR